MNVAIIGSSHAKYHTARQAIDRTVASLIGENVIEVNVFTFLNGGIHHYARDLALAKGWNVHRVRSVEAVIKAEPEYVLLFWDGKSSGIPNVLEALTRGRVTVFSFLISDTNDVRILGSNSHRIPESEVA